jgi:hypothetical protein
MARLANEEDTTRDHRFHRQSGQPQTGTLRPRRFRHVDERSPGYSRVRVPIGFPHEALLVSDGLDTDQGQKICCGR